MKIGLYLQDYRNCNLEIFDRDLTNVMRQGLDLLVFPENCYIPDGNILYNTDIFTENSEARRFALQMSEKLRCAVIVSSIDVKNYIYSIYANAFASDNETETAVYVKHTMAGRSPLGLDDYGEFVEDMFEPVLLKSKRIGMTICYDCNHALFSRCYGKQSVDMIINSSGGNVVYEKWYRYNRVRALENHCFSLCTMGFGENKRSNSYTFGFAPDGRLMMPEYIYENNSEWDKIGNIAVYDTDNIKSGSGECYNLSQTETDNANGTLLISPDDFRDTDDCDVYSYVKDNVEYIIVRNDSILFPEKILKEMYGTPNGKTRYLIVNIWDRLDMDYYNNVLDDVLRVRSMENFCAVMLVSPEITRCFQCGCNRTSQIIRRINGKYRLDLSRMGGAEVIWKNKRGMRAEWRRGYETLISYLTSN